ncbi:MAG: hypothetical protein VCA38_04580 [Roseibacillus sp.]|jgi:hypothetical protein
MKLLSLSIILLAASYGQSFSQRGPMIRGGFEVSPLGIGEPGIAWYTTWESGVKEAERTNRPIMFVAAATQCNGIPGVF